MGDKSRYLLTDAGPELILKRRVTQSDERAKAKRVAKWRAKKKRAKHAR